MEADLKLEPVVSSNVAAIGYDVKWMVLTVQFKNGGTYEYQGVPPSVYEALRTAESIGGYLAKHIKPKFEAKRVDTKKEA